MKKEYDEIQNFIDDVHNEVNLKELVIGLGIVTKNDFERSQFLKCTFY